MSGGRPKALTYRVENIPFGTTEDQLVKDFFYSGDHHDITVKSLAPAVETIEGEEGDLTATILFNPYERTQNGPRIQDVSLTVDQDFYGFTPLYVPSVDKGPIIADVIAVTGLAGHAFGSWAHSDQHMWLRDYLPRDAPNARILTYGYHSKLQGGTSVNTLLDHTNRFVHSLIDMREEGNVCSERPIIFIGHSLGCLIIKKAMTDAIFLGIHNSRLPVREIVFLAAPHRGLNIESLQTLVKGEATEQMILELKSESPTLTWLNQSFSQLARDIDILTCYENKQTKTAIEVGGVWKREGPPVMMVAPDPARGYYPREKTVATDCDHSQIAKIKRGQSGIYPAVKAAVKHGLVSAAGIVARAGDSRHRSPGCGFLFQRSLSDIEPVIEAPMPLGASHGPLNEPSIPHGNVDASPTATNFGAAKPPSDVKHENLDLSIVSLQRLPSSEESQAQAGTPNTTGALGSSEELSLKDEHPLKLTQFDEDIENLAKEFNEAYKDAPESHESRNCTRCSRQIAATEYLYSCWKCDGKSRPIVCNECRQTHSNCDKHKSKKLLRGECRPYTSELLLRSDIEDRSGYEESMQALRRKNTIKIRDYEHLRTFLTSENELGRTPLHIAAEHGFVEDAGLLIESGAATETWDTIPNTPLYTAIIFNQIRVVQVLLDNGAKTEAETGGYYYCNHEKEFALHIAAKCNMWHIVTLLLRKGAAVNAMGDRGTALRESVVGEGKRCVEILPDAGANMNTAVGGFAKESTPLHEACKLSNPDTAYHLSTLLLERGAEVSTSGYDAPAPRTPLMFAAAQGHLHVCKTLLERMGPGVERRGVMLDRALYYAAQNGHENILDFLIAAGAPLVPLYDLPLKRLSRKWKYMRFDSKVAPAAKERILNRLALAPSRSALS